MFHWLCPECGHEIAPGAAECPRCEPAEAAAENQPGPSAQTSELPSQLNHAQAEAVPTQPQGGSLHRSPADPSRIAENSDAVAAPEWELVPAGNSDPVEPEPAGPQSERIVNLAQPADSDRRAGRRPRRVLPERRRVSEQNMQGLQAKPPSWLQNQNSGASWQTPSAQSKRVWKAGVGYVDAAEVDPGSLGASNLAANGLSKNPAARPARPPRRSPRPQRAESAGPVRQPAMQSVEPIAGQPAMEVGQARTREPELGEASLPGPVSEPELASPISPAPQTSVQQPGPASRVDAPEPVLPEPAAPQPPAMDHEVQGLVHSEPPTQAPEPTSKDAEFPLDQPDMAALSVAVEDRSETTTDADPGAGSGDAEPKPLLASLEVPGRAAAPEEIEPDDLKPDDLKPDDLEPAAPLTHRSDELEPIDRLVATIPVPTRPVDAPPGPLYGLASVAAHIPAPVTLLRQPEMRRRSETGIMGAVCEEFLDDPCLRSPEPDPGCTISRSTLTSVAPFAWPEGGAIEVGLDTLPELSLMGGEPPMPESGPEVLRDVARWLAKDLAPAPPPEHTGLVAGEEILPLNGPVLPLELATLEGAGMSAVLQELSPSREEAKGSPKLTGMVMIAVTVVCLGLSALVFGSRSGSEPAPAPPPQENTVPAEVPPPPPAANEPAPPVEVTGFRLVPGEAEKAEIHYLVVNHNGEAIDPVTVNVTLLSDRVTIPVAEFAFRAPALGPYESREMVSPVEGLSDDIDMSVWRNLSAEVRLADPAEAAE